MTASSRDRWATVARHTLTAGFAAAGALFVRGEAMGRDLQRLDTVVETVKEHTGKIDREHDAVIEMRKDIASLLKAQESTDAMILRQMKVLNDKLDSMKK